MLLTTGVLAQRTAAKTATGIAVLPPLLAIVYMLAMTIARWPRLRGSRSRNEVLNRALGRRQASMLTYFLVGYGLLLIVFVAILRP